MEYFYENFDKKLLFVKNYYDKNNLINHNLDAGCRIRNKKYQNLFELKYNTRIQNEQMQIPYCQITIINPKSLGTDIPLPLPQQIEIEMFL